MMHKDAMNLKSGYKSNHEENDKTASKITTTNSSSQPVWHKAHMLKVAAKRFTLPRNVQCPLPNIFAAKKL